MFKSRRATGSEGLTSNIGFYFDSFFSTTNVVWNAKLLKTEERKRNSTCALSLRTCSTLELDKFQMFYFAHLSPSSGQMRNGMHIPNTNYWDRSKPWCRNQIECIVISMCVCKAFLFLFWLICNSTTINAINGHCGKVDPVGSLLKMSSLIFCQPSPYSCRWSFS